MFIAPKRCHGDSHQGTKKELLAAAPQRLIIESSLTQAGSKNALRKLQNQRFKRQSRQIKDSIDWLMWMYPSNAGSFVHSMVDRLMLGDAIAEAHVKQVREEMGL